MLHLNKKAEIEIVQGEWIDEGDVEDVGKNRLVSYIVERLKREL
jgi:hypothetical protein